MHVRLSIHPHFVSFTLGIVIAVSFQCMTALFNPAYRGGKPIKWGIVSYTVAVFSLLTVGTAMQLNGQSTSYVDNRESTSILAVPFKYQVAKVAPDPIRIIQNIIFALNNWLADGLLVSSPLGIVFTHSRV